MIDRTILIQQLDSTVDSVDVPGLQKYTGKVRDCFLLGDRRLLVATDRLSAFDRVLTTVPFKGALLNEFADGWFRSTSHIVQNHVLDRPHPNVFLTMELEMLPVEIIVRRHLTGSGWRDYSAGKAISGVVLPPGLSEFARFDQPIVTPSTKAASGQHDAPISEEEILARGLVPKKTWEEAREIALQLFLHGEREAKKRGLIFVDTKYEFGTQKGELVLGDEIHTPDSSRYWLADSYPPESDKTPVMLDKEFFRSYLLKLGYQGDGNPPLISDEVRVELAERYIQLFEQLTGNTFTPPSDATSDDLTAVLQQYRQ